MKNKRDIYCEYAFWEEFFRMEDEVIRNRNKRRLWDAFYDFLSNNNIFFDVSHQEINENTNGSSNLMEIRRKKGGAGIKFIPNQFPKFEDFSDNDDDRLNAVFLTTLETEVCESLSKRFGVIVFNLSMIFSAKHVYINNGQTFDKNNGHNWTYLQALRELCPSINCCNSLLIADRYLLSDTNINMFDNNLQPIFEALLPQMLDNGIVFNIYIIAENLCESIEDKLRRIEELVRNLRPQLNFSLNIFNSRKLHDRSILTNNIILTSGAGFDVIGHNGIPLRFTTTTLNFPFLHSNISNEYIEWINNVIKVKKSCRRHRIDYWGKENPRHHLLDYYYEEPKKPTARYSLGDAFANVLANIQLG